jgi:hypothetical protein
MARKLGEFFAPNALSCKVFFAKINKDSWSAKVLEVESQPVKKGGEEVLALHLDKPDLWIVCNRTNAEILAKKWTDDVDKWVGRKLRIEKQVTQYQGQEGFKLIPQ